jgi:IS5 family transposase
VLAMSERFRTTGGDSFFGDLVYDRVVPADHFLRRLNQLIAWDDLCRDFTRFYKGGAEYGPAPLKPSLLLKMLFISFLYDLSERQTEEIVNFNLAVKYFVGLAADEPAPDHSTLTVFKRRLSQKWRTARTFDDLMGRIVEQALAKGIALGKLQLLDSAHAVACVEVAKEDKRRKDGKPPRDADAKWGNKYFYGYKQHLSVNADSGIVTSAVHTSGEATDGKQLRALVEKDEACGVEAEVYAGDKAYDDGDNHAYLEHAGKKSALTLNDYRTQKKDANKGKWLELAASAEYQAGQEERYKVERKIAEGRRHGSKACRYLGLVRYAIQGYMTVIVLNLKRMVWLLTGTRLRATGHRCLAMA